MDMMSCAIQRRSDHRSKYGTLASLSESGVQPLLCPAFRIGNGILSRVESGQVTTEMNVVLAAIRTAGADARAPYIPRPPGVVSDRSGIGSN